VSISGTLLLAKRPPTWFFDAKSIQVVPSVSKSMVSMGSVEPWMVVSLGAGCCYIIYHCYPVRMALEQILIVGAEIYYDGQFLSAQEAGEFFDALLAKCSWRRHKTSFGSAVPRDEAYYGDPGTHYTYSRREYKPLPWIPELLALKERVEAATPVSVYENLRLPVQGYNAVLCNLYRDGTDSVGLHADNEPEMAPVIASVSLGSARLFRIRGKGGSVVYSKPLPHGSLLIMAGTTQKHFKHEVPKEPGVTGSRINLTFRRIEHR
jgi:alkylated DNA repair dioxygenase AlkB